MILLHRPTCSSSGSPISVKPGCLLICFCREVDWQVPIPAPEEQARNNTPNALLNECSCEEHRASSGIVNKFCSIMNIGKWLKFGSGKND